MPADGGTQQVPVSLDRMVDDHTGSLPEGWKGANGELGDPKTGVCQQSGSEDPRTLEWEPYRDSIITTPGAEPFDTPRLMLVRGVDNGRTVEIREPAS